MKTKHLSKGEGLIFVVVADDGGKSLLTTVCLNASTHRHNLHMTPKLFFYFYYRPYIVNI